MPDLRTDAFGLARHLANKSEKACRKNAMIYFGKNFEPVSQFRMRLRIFVQLNRTGKSGRGHPAHNAQHEWQRSD